MLYRLSSGRWSGIETGEFEAGIHHLLFPMLNPAHVPGYFLHLLNRTPVSFTPVHRLLPEDMPGFFPGEQAKRMSGLEL